MKFNTLISLTALTLIANAGCNNGINLPQKLIGNATFSSFSQDGNGFGKVFMKSPSFDSPSPNAYTIGLNRVTSRYTVSPIGTLNFDSKLVNVTISGTRNGLLRNGDISILSDVINSAGDLVPGGNVAKPNVYGNWLFSSVSDPDHQLGQLMAYYWLNHEKDVANNALPNSWNASGKNISVYSRCYDANGVFSSSTGAGLNAFWESTNELVCMSYVEGFEAAYDASVYAHEMGHANIDFGTKKQIATGAYSIVCPGNNTADCCPSADGCAGAINEGQADVHSFIVFNSPIIGEYFTNKTTGLTERDAEINSSLTAQAQFTKSAEIHDMGAVWNASWWTLRNSLGADIADKLFFAHLNLLTGNDTFKTALNQIIVTDAQLVTNKVFTTDHRTQILAAFAIHGITP